MSKRAISDGLFGFHSHPASSGTRTMTHSFQNSSLFRRGTQDSVLLWCPELRRGEDNVA